MAAFGFATKIPYIVTGLFGLHGKFTNGVFFFILALSAPFERDRPPRFRPFNGGGPRYGGGVHKKDIVVFL
jgi:hypothetical protein